ncbi:MAG: hypothetical protein EBR82_19020 [Caulobacteraceae bacterium]|nr:hypothetical protein [Caulobacteraceae bacterium]
MSYKILVTNPSGLRDAIQQNDLLFDAVKELVEEYADARDPRWHHIAKQTSVVVTRVHPLAAYWAAEGRLGGEKNRKTSL